MWFRRTDFGGVAQLGERVNGIHEVRGSIPLASTDVPMHTADASRCTPEVAGGSTGESHDEAVSGRLAQLVRALR
jgi:hypothetical protein